MWTLDEGTTWHHRHFVIDLMNCYCQPALLIDFGLKQRTVHHKLEFHDCADSNSISLKKNQLCDLDAILFCINR